jgi:hypothetical protein
VKLYHYTDRITGAEIVRAGVVRAQPLRLHRELLATDEGHEVGPLVWLTSSPEPDRTVLAKMMVAGWPRPPIGHVWRIAVRGDLPTLTLPEYMHQVDLDTGWWNYLLRTAALAGAEPAAWRVLTTDIPAADWLAVERWAAPGRWLPAERDRYLQHVTLSTGHSIPSPRSEVGDDVVQALRPLLQRALRGEHVPIPRVTGYTVSGAAFGRCCELRVRGPAGLALTIGVAAHSRCGARLWRELHHHRPELPTSPLDAPAEPWCADRIEPGYDAAGAAWAADFSRCMAWTWIEMRDSR